MLPTSTATDNDIIKAPPDNRLRRLLLSKWGMWVSSLVRKKSNTAREGVIFACMTRTFSNGEVY